MNSTVAVAVEPLLLLTSRQHPLPFLHFLGVPFLRLRDKFLGIFAGDTVMLRGRRRRETVIVAQPDPELDADGKGDRVRVTRQVRRNIRCHLGDN